MLRRFRGTLWRDRLVWTPRLHTAMVRLYDEPDPLHCAVAAHEIHLYDFLLEWRRRICRGDTTVYQVSRAYMYECSRSPLYIYIYIYIGTFVNYGNSMGFLSQGELDACVWCFAAWTELVHNRRPWLLFPTHAHMCGPSSG